MNEPVFLQKTDFCRFYLLSRFHLKHNKVNIMNSHVELCANAGRTRHYNF